MKAAELETLHSEVWALRRDLEPHWPTPSSLDSLRYAFTEIAEALSDWLRLNRPNHRRNHEREPDLYGELADTALMLLTALGPAELALLNRDTINFGSPTLDAICEDVADALARKADNAYFWREFTIAALEKIADYAGMELTAELRARMAKLRAKWTPAEPQEV